MANDEIPIGAYYDGFLIWPWLDNAWRALSSRSQEVLKSTAAGQTLESVGNELGLTRERIRQIRSLATKQLCIAQMHDCPDLKPHLLRLMDGRTTVIHSEFASAMPCRVRLAQSLVLESLGFVHPSTPLGSKSGLWSLEGDALNKQLVSFVNLMPINVEEAQSAAQSLGISDQILRSQILESEYKVVKTSSGWIRAGRRTRDLAYLRLQSEGSPLSVTEISRDIDAPVHATRGNMRRDPSFVQLRPEGTWALSDWHIRRTSRQYSSAIQVVIAVLLELGPLTFEELRTECQRRYPVSNWRIKQCLSSNAIGRTKSGKLDLAERGAVPIEDTEPRQPKTMSTSGAVVGVEIPVTHDVLRGSGIAIHRWLTWYLGLRTAPSTRVFLRSGNFGDLTVRRGIGGSQLSSLRAEALALGVVEGCKLVILLHLDGNTASVQHSCSMESCPAPRDHARST